MNREDKCKLAIEKGYKYNPETGKIFGLRGKEIIGKNGKGYIQFLIYKDSKKYFLLAHQFAWYCINKECVDYLDHINGIRDDNKICNLRHTSNKENMWNTKAKGYYWSKNRKKWSSQIMVDNKSIFLGHFDKEEDARQAYLKAKEKYHII